MFSAFWQRTLTRGVRSDEKLRQAEIELHRSVVMMWQSNGVQVTRPEIKDVQGIHTVTWANETADDEAIYPVVCLHGYGTGSGIYSTSLPLLINRSVAKIHALDTPGCGLSVREEAWSNLSREQAEEIVVSKLEQWRAMYAYEKIVLVGHSIGAILATAYVERYPERCAGLILASPAGTAAKIEQQNTSSSFLSSRNLLAMIWHYNLVNPFSLFRLFPEWGHRNLSAYVQRRFHGHTMQDIKIQLRDYLYENIMCGHVLGASLVTLLLEPLSPQVGIRPLENRLSDPNFLRPDTTLAFMYGDRDWMDKAPAIRIRSQLQSHKRQTSIVCVRDANHNLMLDNPLGFCTALVATLPSNCFLKKGYPSRRQEDDSYFFLT